MTIQLPEAFESRAGSGVGPEWPAIRAKRLAASNDQLDESPRSIHVNIAGNYRVVFAGDDDTHNQASLVVGAGNARFTATAIPKGAAGNNIRIAIAASANAPSGLTVTAATAAGVTTITFTFRTGDAVTAEFLTLAFAENGPAIGSEEDLRLARSLVRIALTAGSDGSGDIAAAAATALAGGTSTSPAITLALQAGINELSIRKLISVPSGGIVTGLF